MTELTRKQWQIQSATYLGITQMKYKKAKSQKLRGQFSLPCNHNQSESIFKYALDRALLAQDLPRKKANEIDDRGHTIKDNPQLFSSH